MATVGVAVVLSGVPLCIAGSGRMAVPEHLFLPGHKDGLRHGSPRLSVEKHPDSGVFLTEVVCVFEGGTGLPSTGRPL